ncbi:uncharacterized protein [Rhodnius prolixus]|uniref:uncharacterized protein n=1 Tax=Rhodnius prolixus TaxID=13249 RepID=UPI003D18FB16
MDKNLLVKRKTEISARIIDVTPGAKRSLLNTASYMILKRMYVDSLKINESDDNEQRKTLL